MDSFPNLIFLFSPIVLGDYYPRAAGKAQKETDQHVDDGGDGSYSGVGFIADIPPNYP